VDSPHPLLDMQELRNALEMNRDNTPSFSFSPFPSKRRKEGDESGSDEEDHLVEKKKDTPDQLDAGPEVIFNVRKWRTAQSFVVVGIILFVVGLGLGLIIPSSSYCQVPIGSYSFYDTSLVYTYMSCKVSFVGWYIGAPIITSGILCFCLAFYYSWVQMQEFVLLSQYKVHFV